MADYNVQDINAVIYNAVSTPLTADGNSSTIDFKATGGCPEGSEIVLSVSDVEAGESVVFELHDNRGGSLAATGYKLAVTANGTYYWPISNRQITGSQLRIAHDVTLASGTDGIKVHGTILPGA